ncbi:hypothetical protein [Polycladidibacter hongkongensis]|uniref:hypothetical protein n=1 Tax=Polycladidibacter hongkongensis TaxID=1647556 RepID=UPI0008328612|nr:hypothetical protein [Pseudovibrio hongkongensis]
MTAQQLLAQVQYLLQRTKQANATLEERNEGLRAENENLKERLGDLMDELHRTRKEVGNASGKNRGHKRRARPLPVIGHSGATRQQAEENWTSLTAANQQRSADPADNQSAGQGPCLGGDVRTLADREQASGTEFVPHRRNQRPAA